MGGPQTVRVPHLGGIDVGYQLSGNYDPNKPTVVLINSFMTSKDLYSRQFANKELTNVTNLLAIDLLGHGDTRTEAENFTYWDTAIMNLQVVDALGIKGKIFALGTSQGGWVTVRMALLAPKRVAGIIPLGTSMDAESARSRDLGCWDGVAVTTHATDQWTLKVASPDFVLEDPFIDQLIDLGFGKDCPQQDRAFWLNAVKASYTGDEGRRRARMAAINLGTRDGLHPRLFDVRCPVLWMHGTADVVYSVSNAEEEIGMFVNSPDAGLVVVENGQHFLSFDKPQEVDKAVIDFVSKYGK